MLRQFKTKFGKFRLTEVWPVCKTHIFMVIHIITAEKYKMSFDIADKIFKSNDEQRVRTDVLEKLLTFKQIPIHKNSEFYMLVTSC